MNQQERILSLAQEQIQIIGTSGARFGKTYKAAFELAIRFTLENLWISVDELLPELPKELPSAAVSEIVLIKCVNGAITRARYVKILGDFTTYVWQCVDAGFGVWDDKVTHWMPIPKLKEGGAQ
jgi:hypothetical protein